MNRHRPLHSISDTAWPPIDRRCNPFLAERPCASTAAARQLVSTLVVAALATASAIALGLAAPQPAGSLPGNGKAVVTQQLPASSLAAIGRCSASPVRS